jgi:thioredoxin 1
MRRVFTATTAVAIIAMVAGCSPGPEQTPPGVFESNLPQTSDARFEKDVIDSNKPVLVDFFATWCAPCRKMEPVLSEIAERYKGKVKVIQVDVDKNPEIAERYRIEAIPRLMLFRNGDLVEDMLGSTTAEQLSRALDSTLPSRSTAAAPGEPL